MPRAKKDPAAPKPKRDKLGRRDGAKHVVEVDTPIEAIEVKRVGYHSAFTEPVRIEILAMLTEGLPRYYACARAGITERTLRSWMRKGEENLEEIDAAISREEPLPELTAYGAFAREVMRTEAKARSEDVDFIRTTDDWRARAWYLERMDHRRWNATTKHQLMTEGEDGEPVDAGVLLLEQLDQMAERLTRAAGRSDDEGK